MRYSTDFTILSHDTGHNGEVHPSASCRYLQEAADSQMRHDGPTYRELIDHGYSFLLNRLHVKWHHSLRAYDNVTVQTWAYDPPRGASFERYYALYRDDTLIAEAASVWALMDLGTMQLCRVGTVPLHYGTDEPLPLSTRLRLPSVEFETAGTHTVRYADVDVNNHMNNTRYADMLCNFIPDIDRVRITDLQIHYLAEAPLDSVLTIRRALTEEDGHPTAWFETVREDGTYNVRARVDLQYL